MYEDPKQLPLLRLSWNKQDPNYLATFSMDSTEVWTRETYMSHVYMHVTCLLVVPGTGTLTGGVRRSPQSHSIVVRLGHTILLISDN